MKSEKFINDVTVKNDVNNSSCEIYGGISCGFKSKKSCEICKGENNGSSN